MRRRAISPEPRSRDAIFAKNAEMIAGVTNLPARHRAAGLPATCGSRIYLQW